MSQKEFNISSNKIISICLGVFLIVTLLKILGVLGIVPHSLAVNFKPTNTDITLSWLDVGVLELMQTASVFVLFKYLYKSTSSIYGGVKNILQKDILNKFIVSVSRASYGMYLINRTLMLFCDYNIVNLSLSGKQMVMCFLILTISIFFVSWILIVILSKIPFVNKFSGYA